MAEKWKKFGNILDDEAKDALYESGVNFGALSSDDERIDAALEVMRSNKNLWKKARYDKLRYEAAKRLYNRKGEDPFDIDHAAGYIKSWENVTGSDGKTKLTPGDQFYDEYWKADKQKRAYWKQMVEDELGTGAWEEVKKRLNARLAQESADQSERERVKILEGKAEDQGASDWLASAWWRLFSGRTKDKALQKKKVEAKDILADVGEDLAMLTPLGAKTLLGKVGMAAAVPLLSETADAIMYDVPEPDEHGSFKPEDLANMNPNDLAERATFNPLDVAVGTVTNLAVPGLMNAAGKRLASRILGGKGESGMSKDVMEDLVRMRNELKWKPATSEGYTSEKLKNFYQDAAEQLRNEAYRTTKAEKGLMQPEEWAANKDKIIGALNTIENAQKSGNKKLEKAGKGQLRRIVGDDRLLTDKQYYGNASILDELMTTNPATSKVYIENLPYNAEANELASIRPNLSKKAEEQALTKAQQFENRADEIYNAYTDRFNKLNKGIVAQAKDRFDNAGIEWYNATGSGNPKRLQIAEKEFDEAKKGYTKYVKPAQEKAKKYAFNSLTPSERIMAGLKTDNKEFQRAVLESDASMLDLFRLSHPEASKHMGGASEILTNFVGNKVGNQSHADKAIAPVDAFLGTSISKDVKKIQAGINDESKKNQSKAILNAMADGSDNEEDKKWLRKIAEQPGLVKGYGSDANDPKFRKWMLTRGTDILRGTELFRPTPAAE